MDKPPTIDKAKTKSLWDYAPRPKFYEREEAERLVKEGIYSSIDESYIEIKPERKKKLEEQTLKYRKRHEAYRKTQGHRLIWDKAKLPRKI